MSEAKRRWAREGRARLDTRPSMEVRVYPNVIYVIEDGKDLLAITPDQWGELAEIVGIRRLSEGGSDV